jgi:hypothetical protein
MGRPLDFIVPKTSPMKSILKILLIVAVVAAIYFITIGRNDLYRFIDAAGDVIQSFADNYRRK